MLVLLPLFFLVLFQGYSWPQSSIRQINFGFNQVKKNSHNLKSLTVAAKKTTAAKAIAMNFMMTE